MSTCTPVTTVAAEVVGEFRQGEGSLFSINEFIFLACYRETDDSPQRADELMVLEHHENPTGDSLYYKTVTAPPDSIVLYRSRYEEDNCATPPTEFHLWAGSLASDSLKVFGVNSLQALKLEYYGVHPDDEYFFAGNHGSGSLFDVSTNIVAQIIWEGEEGTFVRPRDAQWIDSGDVRTYQWTAGSACTNYYDVYLPANVSVLVCDHDSNRTGAQTQYWMKSGSLVPSWFTEAQDVLRYKLKRSKSGKKISRSFVGVFDISQMSEEAHEYNDGVLIFWGHHRFARVAQSGTVLFSVPAYFEAQEGREPYWVLREYPVSHLKKVLTEKGLPFKK